MCKHCKVLDMMAEKSIEIVDELHRSQNLEMTPTSAALTLRNILDEVGMRAMRILAEVATADLAEKMGLKRDCTSEELRNEILKRHKEGTLSPHLEAMLKELLDGPYTILDQDDDQGLPPGSDLLN
jgi:hypothetical protein